MEGIKSETDMKKESEQAMIATFVIGIVMLLIMIFMQMRVINECFDLHDDQQEVIERQNALIDTLMIRNDRLWDKLIEVKDKDR